MINLVALPCLCVDVFDGTDELRAGGEALNFAVHASKFEEFNVSILGAVGQDSYAKFIMDSVSDKRIDVSHVRVEEDKVTANNRTYLTADGDRYYKDDSWTGDIVDKMILNQDELDFIKKSEVVFIHFWAGCFEQIIDLKKNNNFRLAVDFVEYRNFKEMEKYAPYIDYFLISGEESILPIFEAFSKKYKGLFNASLADKGSGGMGPAALETFLLAGDGESRALACDNGTFREIVLLYLRSMRRDPDLKAQLLMLCLEGWEAQPEKNAVYMQQMKLILQGCLRSGDPFTQIGAGQYWVLLPGAGSETHSAIAQRLQQAMHQRFAQSSAVFQTRAIDLRGMVHLAEPKD